MNILLINTYDRGGAANSCIRLHNGLLKQGVNSNLLLLHKAKDVRNSHPFIIQKMKSSTFFKLLNKIKIKIAKKFNFEFLKPKLTEEQNFLKQRENNLEFFSFPFSDFDITTSKLYQDADIINLHWVADFLDYESFFKKNKKPVVWTLHDMNPFTGGEHYVEMEYGINAQGKPLKRNVSIIEKKYTENNLKIKLNALCHSNDLSIVAPSKWLQDEAAASLLFKNRDIRLIPYGMDSQIFKNRNVSFSRDLFEIPLNKKVILFVADSISNSRKGYVYLKRALERLDNDEVLLCSIGKGEPKLESSVDVKHLGEIKDERIISLIYSLADVFVIPSLMDNLPNTVLESLICGTPVIGFPTGGIPDMIEHKKNGLLTDELSVDSLKNTIEYFLDNGVEFSREQIREQAVKKYDQNVQAKKYIGRFKEILEIT